MPETAPPASAISLDPDRDAPGRLKLGRLAPSAQALAITLAFVCLRLITSPFVGLGVDESYTVAISRQLSLSYFDHPPLHQWMVWLAEHAGLSGRWIRAPFIVLSGLTSWLMFLLTRRLFGAVAGVWATLALNLSGFFTAAAGAWILPDGPLNLWLLASTLTLATILIPTAGQDQARRWRAWLTFGLCIGLAGLSKYQAALFGVGLCAFLVSTKERRGMLFTPPVLAAAGLALIVISPVFLWNAEHGWVSFAFQGARGGVRHGPQPIWAFVAITGQAALALPWIYAPLVVAAVDAVRRGPSDAARWLCLMLGAPAVLVFSLTPIWGEHALPHWSMSGWLLLFPILGAWLAEASRRRVWPRAWAWASTFATLGLWVLAASESDTGWMREAFPEIRHDPTVETVPWTGVRRLVRRAQAAGVPCLFVAGLNWRDGGKIAAAVGDLAPVRVLSSDPRGFGFLAEPPNLQNCDAVIIGAPAEMQDRFAELTRRFASLQPWTADHEGRGGRSETELAVVYGRRLLAPLPSAYAGPSAPPKGE